MAPTADTHHPSHQLDGLERQLPAAAIAFDAPSVDPEVLGRITSKLLPRPGLDRLGEDLLLSWPSAREPAIFDSAIHTGLRVADLLREEEGEEASLDLRVLILPTRGFIGRGRARVEGDSVVQALRESTETPIEPGIHLTSRAAYSLEAGWTLAEGKHYESPAGPLIPLARLAEPSYRTARRRNMRVLRREMSFVGRKPLLAELRSLLDRTSPRVTGPLGCGKSRLLWEALRDRPGTTVWCAPFLGGTLGLSLPEELWSQLARQTPTPDYIIATDAEERRQRAEAQIELWLQERSRGNQPCTIVFDDLDRAPVRDLDWLDRLVERVRAPVHLALVSRPRSWSERCEELPEVEVGTVGESTCREIVAEIAFGLEMPESVLDRVIEASGGNLFALEEGLHELTHRGSISQVHGSFFFGGSSDTSYAPSARWICHVQAEVERLGLALPLLALAAFERPVPKEVLTDVATALDVLPSSGWATRHDLSGWLRTTGSPWGPGIRFACRALAYGLRATLTETAYDALRSEVGKRLFDRSPDLPASWELYRATSGTPEGRAWLLQILGHVLSEFPREVAFEAILLEAEKHSEQGGDPATELKLLWTLLPLAHRMGRLGMLQPQLTRALELANDAPEKRIALLALRARLARDERRINDAESYLQEALGLALREESRRKGVLALELSALMVEQERLDEARTLLEQLLNEATGSRSQAASCHFRLAEIARLQNRYDDALELHREALAERRELGSAISIGRSLCGLAEVHLLRGDYPHALQRYREARALFAERNEPRDEALALGGVGRVLCHLGRYSDASGPLRKARHRLQDRDNVLEESRATLSVAENHLDLGQFELAEKLASAALFQLDLLDDERARADAEQIMGRIRFRQHRYEEARGHLHAALEGHHRYRSPAQEAQDRSHLLELEIARSQSEAAERISVELDHELQELTYPGRRELMELRLFRALTRLREWGIEPPVDPNMVIARAYRHLMRKTSFLDQRQRHRFLLEVAENQAIVQAAGQQGIHLP